MQAGFQASDPPSSGEPSAPTSRPPANSPAAVAACLALCLDGNDDSGSRPWQAQQQMQLHEALGLGAEAWSALLAEACAALRAQHQAPDDERERELLGQLSDAGLCRLTLSAGTAVCMADQHLTLRESALLLRMRERWRVEPDLLATVQPARGVRAAPQAPRPLRPGYQRGARKTPWWRRLFGG